MRSAIRMCWISLAATGFVSAIVIGSSIRRWRTKSRNFQRVRGCRDCTAERARGAVTICAPDYSADEKVIALLPTASPQLLWRGRRQSE